MNNTININPLTAEDIQWWKDNFQRIEDEALGLGRKELIEDLWSRDLPIVEIHAICCIKWPDTLLTDVTATYNRMADEFHQEMAKLLKLAAPKIRRIE